MIYIIDDESHSYGWLTYMLGRLGHEVTPFSEATKAYSALIQVPMGTKDVVLVDLMLVSGFALPDAPDFFNQLDWRAGLRLAQALFEADRDKFRGRLAILTAQSTIGEEDQRFLTAEGIPVINKAQPGDEIVAAILALIKGDGG